MTAYRFTGLSVVMHHARFDPTCSLGIHNMTAIQPVNLPAFTLAGLPASRLVSFPE